MRLEQKEILSHLIFCLILLVIGVWALLEYPKAFIPIGILLMLLCSASYAFSGGLSGAGYGKDSLMLGDYVENEPILKIWLVLSCALVVPISLYVIWTSEDEILRNRLFFIAFASVILPPIIYMELARFKDAGRDD